MEELRSTDILDKEILLDAEKKAVRLRERAETESKKILEQVESRVEEELQTAKDVLAKKLSNFERDLNASVSLEKERFLVSFVQDTILKKVNEYSDSLSEEKKLSLCINRAKKIDLKDRKFNAFVYGFDLNKAENELKKILGTALIKVEKTEYNKILYEDFSLDKNEGIILISENEDLKSRLTLSQIFGEVIDKYRDELATSLFGTIQVE